jgi:SAM-dependent methyltransferase
MDKAWPDTHEMTDDGFIVPKEKTTDVSVPAVKGYESVKLDLGAMDVSPDGYKPMGNYHGSSIYPLEVPDESVDVIRASHVLEHFSFWNTVNVLQNWVSKLKPGGMLKIAVPNFEWIAQNYLDGKDIPVEWFTLGAQSDESDFHHAIFDKEKLTEAMRLAGLIELREWEADCDDCSKLEVSLNIQGIKPKPVVPSSQDPFKVCAAMSLPRLGFCDFFFGALEALGPMGITIRRHMGAYWEVGLERSMATIIEEDNPDAILTLDYDTVFRRADVEGLIKVMRERPEVDAVAAIQSARSWHEPLMSFDLPLGVKTIERVPPGVFLADDITELRTAHFGLTLIRTSSLLKAKKPWMNSIPAPDGTWKNNERCDADVSFWKNWRESGLKIFSANRVVVGHLELMVRWPDKNFNVILQLPKDYGLEGKPKGIWE